MAKRTWIWVGSLVVITTLGGIKIRNNMAEAELKEQLRLAWAEGISTNADQFASLIVKVPPSENAGPYYTSMVGKGTGHPFQQLNELLATLTATTLASAKAYLRARGSAMGLIDAAVLLPKCSFDRDWSRWESLDEREIVEMRSASGILALRGAISAQNGDWKSAIADVDRMFRVAQHARLSGALGRNWTTDRPLLDGFHLLSFWAFTHPNQPGYLRALERAIASFPKPDVKAERRGDLFLRLQIAEMSMTPEGRNALGLKRDDLGAPDQILPKLLSQTEARITIIKAYRRAWEALALPLKERDVVLDEVESKINRALWAFPGQRYGLGHSSYGHSRQEEWESRRLQYVALARALAKGRPPKSLDTKDILSPYDGTPLTYAFDGKQITIKVSRNDRDDLTLQVPSYSVMSLGK